MYTISQSLYKPKLQLATQRPCYSVGLCQGIFSPSEVIVLYINILLE